MLQSLLILLVYVAVFGVGVYLAVRFGVRDGMADLEKRNRANR